VSRELRKRIESRFPGAVPGPLAIEIGMHRGDIMDADVDRAGKMLVTGSIDKTVRVWALDTGRPITVLRMPGERGDGVIHAVAVAPDGRQIAVGGWDGRLRVFDTDGWRLRLEKPPSSTIDALRYSPDGKRLALGLWSKNGVRVLETAGYTEVFADRHYAGDCYGLAFNGAGQLAVASWDGSVRLYSPDYQLVASRQFPERPHRVAFDVAGRRLSVGFVGRPVMRTLAIPSLDVIHELSVQSDDATDSLGSVGVATDGTLLAAGRYSSAGRNPVARWSRNAKRLPDWRLSTNTVKRLLALRDGSLAITSQDPLVGVLDARGQTRWVQRAEVPDWRGDSPIFEASSDARVIRFAWDRAGHDQIAFALDGPGQPAMAAVPPLHAATSEHADYPLASWHHLTGPTLGGKLLSVEKFEPCRSLAIDAPRDRFFLGCEWHLYAFAKTGAQIWSILVPGAVRAVNLSDDGAVVITATDDGTIHWLDARDGSDALTLLFYGDALTGAREWIAWTPAGVYTGSEAGERALGIQVSRAGRTPDLVPVADFADLMRRPAAIREALEKTARAQRP
jgi:WD40 repeat protein